MIHHPFFNPLEKALRIYAVLYLAIVIFQLVGLVMYAVNVWPEAQHSVSSGMVYFLPIALFIGFARSFVWIRIYWKGGRALATLRTEGESSRLSDHLVPILGSLTTHLVVSCVLDFLFLPAYFVSDTLLPFAVAGWRLGVVELARLLFPQAFGFAALILAFLTHQYGQFLKERSEMQEELELTI
jgi:hypothetical protein